MGLLTDLLGDGNATSALEAWSDFADQADGTPTTLGSGQAVEHTKNSEPNAGLRVVSGKLTNTATNAGTAAGYICVDLGSDVKRIGADFTFSAKTTDGGSAVLVVWDGDLGDTYPTIPNSPCHLRVRPDGWSFDVWEANALSVVTSGTFKTALAADDTTTHRCEVTLTGDTARILFPDGSTATIEDARIASNAGMEACWEVYQDTASTDTKAAFVSVWADSEGVSRRFGAAHSEDVVQAISAASPVTVHQYAPATELVVVAPTSSAPIDATNLFLNDVLVPASGRLLIEMEGYIEMSAAANVVWLAGLSGGSTASGSASVVNQQWTGRARFSWLFTGLTPGVAVDVTWRHFCTVASTCTFKARDSSGRPAVMKAIAA